MQLCNDALYESNVCRGKWFEWKYKQFDDCGLLINLNERIFTLNKGYSLNIKQCCRVQYL